MNFFSKTLLTLSVSASVFADGVDTPPKNNSQIETVVVTADFREAELLKMPASVTVMSNQDIQHRNAQHLEQLLALAPNVNFSSGSSRARYIQIRGIGERSQFASPVDPSVGTIIDDVDFSGIGTAGTMFDVKQVEILRGPQGTRYGASALAGVIAVQSQDPTEEFQAYVEGMVAEYDSWSLGAAAGGSISENVMVRASVQKHESDGYIDNDFLNRDDTNNLDELTARTKVRWVASDDLTIDTSLFYVDIDNGYDAFSLDNNRNTLSDEPGHDRQKTKAISIKADWSVSSALNIQAISSYADSDLEYGYDEDWSYLGLCTGTPCAGWEYSSTDNYDRDRENGSLEFRMISGETGRIFNNTTDWLVGIYFKDQSEELHREYTYLAADFFSDYDTENIALFAELATDLSERLTLTVGARVEDWQADYSDSDALVVESDETLYGGKVVLDYLVEDNNMIYASIARGYKAGGVNTDGSLSIDDREFDTEYQWAYELGLKSSLLDNRMQLRLAAFYTSREDQQVKGSVLITHPDLSTEFIDYIDNAAEGDNYGLEVEVTWQVIDALQLSASAGWLETEFEKYINKSGDDLSGRDQAHAPSYQYAVSAQYDFMKSLYARVEVEGKDGFYFSDSHNAKSDSYYLVNAKLGYEIEEWSVSLWARNLTDEDYDVRGFRFPNDPRDFYATNTYTQLGEPRVVGVTGRYNF